MTIAEAAELTGLSRAALEARIRRRTLPAQRIGRRVYLDLVTLYELRLIRLSPGATVSELLERLERQAELIGRLRAEVDHLRQM